MSVVVTETLSVKSASELAIGVSVNVSSVARISAAAWAGSAAVDVMVKSPATRVTTALPERV
jgi:hypothetical protein